MGQLLSSLGSRGGEMVVPEIAFDIESKCIMNNLITSNTIFNDLDEKRSERRTRKGEKYRSDVIF